MDARQATARGAYWNTDCIEGACGTLNGARPGSPGVARCLRAQIRPETAALTSGSSRSRGATGSGAASTTCANCPPTSGRSTIRGNVPLGADGWAVFPIARPMRRDCAGPPIAPPDAGEPKAVSAYRLRLSAPSRSIRNGSIRAPAIHRGPNSSGVGGSRRRSTSS